MKKEYLILTVIIAALAAYLFFYKEDRTHYTLPELPTVDKKAITSIELTRKNQSIVFALDNGTWVLTDEKFTADSPAIENMLDVIKTLKVTTLVSETGDLARYQLDENNRTGIRALSDDVVVREFFIGKEAPTFNHTFISFKSDQNVYHAAGSFKTTFEKDMDAFRDRTILTIAPETIQQITIEKDGIEKKLTRQSKTDNTENPTDEPEEDITSWVASDDSVVDQDIVRSLMSGLADVKCDRFLTSDHINDAEKSPFLFTIRLNDDMYMKISPKNDDLLYPGNSSHSRYAFLLSSRTVDHFIQDIDKLLGIITNEDTDETEPMM